MYAELLGHASRSLPYFRGKDRLLRYLCPRHRICPARVAGFRMDLDLGEFKQRRMFLGYCEREETRLVQRLLRPGMTVVDVGASVGYYTALAACAVRAQGRVLAFEPSPYAFEKLERWITANRVRQVTAFPIGLSDREGALVLYIPPASLGNHDPSVVEYCADMQPVTVPVRRLGEVLGALGIRRVDLLKVDVEGHEPQVFAGYEKGLRSGQVRHLLCEFNDPLLRSCGSSARELLDYLRSLGFRTDAATWRLESGVCNLLLSHAAG